MNKITQAERDSIDQYALGIVRLDDEGKIENYTEAVLKLTERHSISRERARRHVAKAARRLLYAALKQRRR